jgi:hypothetical protein
MEIRQFARPIGILLLLLGLTACGNGGSINFIDGGSTSQTGISSFNMVPASQALAVESGKTPANGYHAKLQLNPLKGQALSGSGGYKATMKLTTRPQ